MNPVLYVAGPMRGLPSYNFPAFDAAEEHLYGLGFETISPAQHDREQGFDPDKDNTEVLDFRELILWDLEQVAYCDGIYLLEGWEKSQGARLEHDLARFLRKAVLFEGEV